MKFKKLVKSLSICIAVALLATTLTTVNANEGTKPSREKIIEEFNELQKEIDEVLDIKGNKYVFDKTEVIQVVNDSDFDFNTYNEYFNTNYTKDVFADTAVHLIETANLEYKSVGENTCSVRGTYCGKNGTSSGWNYDRFYNNKTNSEKSATKLDELSRNWALVAGSSGGISAFLPGIGTAIAAGIGLGAGWNSWYAGTLAAAIRSNNSDGNCGTVTDINKFTTVFSVWSQREFNV